MYLCLHCLTDILTLPAFIIYLQSQTSVGMGVGNQEEGGELGGREGRQLERRETGGGG